MITKEALAAYGADVNDGIARCMGMEDFYLQLAEMQLDDANFDRLIASAEAGDVKAVFEAAHALKGALGNLSITPLTEPVEAITERLRGAETMPDISDLMDEYKIALEGFRALAK